VDVRLPAVGEPRPLVVVVHGGFWRAAYDRSHTGPQCAGLVAAGYVVATVEYRRVRRWGGGWPDTFDDVAAVTDLLPGLVADALPGRVDQGRTVLVGHSAGGHLAVWAASRHRLPPSSPWRRADPLPVRGVVSLAGVLDLRLAEERGLGDRAVRALLGGRRRVRTERLAAADPAGLLPTGVPTVLLHGTEDVAVPVEVSRAYAGAAGAAGDPVRLHELAGVGHFELIDPLSAAWPTVLDAVAGLVP
jgi:acetyl esterase/lipase